GFIELSKPYTQETCREPMAAAAKVRPFTASLAYQDSLVSHFLPQRGKAKFKSRRIGFIAACSECLKYYVGTFLFASSFRGINDAELNICDGTATLYLVVFQ
ncbi:unnamed protein product, partial [Ixodes pacificus]